MSGLAGIYISVAGLNENATNNEWYSTGIKD